MRQLTMDVLYLCEFVTLNGGENSLLAVLPHVLAKGLRACVALPAAGELTSRLGELGVDVVPFSPAAHPSLTIRRSALSDLLRATRPRLMHANSLSMSRLSGPVMQELRIQSIGHLRDIVRLSDAAITDINRHTRLVAVSQATADWHIAAGLAAHKLRIVHNGVDLTRFAPRPATGYLHEELGLPASAPLLGAVGQIGMRKGLDVLLAAVRSLFARHAEPHLVVVGERHSAKEEAVEFERSLHSAAMEPPLAGRVHFLGRRSDVPRLLAELTLLVHAARQEPLGRVLLEAAAVGVPIVATEVGGTPEIFPPQQHAALLVPPDSVAAFAAAIERVLVDGELRRQLASQARRQAVSAFDVRIAAQQLLAVYGELL